MAVRTEIPRKNRPLEFRLCMLMRDKNEKLRTEQQIAHANMLTSLFTTLLNYIYIMPLNVAVNVTK